MSVKLINSKAVISRFKLARDRMKDPTPLMRDTAIKLQQATITRFALQKDPFGIEWKISQRVLRDGGQTLTDTGILRGSIRFGFGKNFAEVFTRGLIYAAVHNYGLAAGPRAGFKMPKRQFIGFGPQDERMLIALASEYISKPFS